MSYGALERMHKIAINNCWVRLVDARCLMKDDDKYRAPPIVANFFYHYPVMLEEGRPIYW